ncbi:T-complex protein 1 subunit beta [Parasteatoda tepidariorum]|uniref:T-complex protein 1 subunit beta n=1 Tax=Parasteatoda tepidariorum TaxID=114398 RepID=UPI001C720648|nr:T-complex protein 1 subunit beta [Parasteatoda tepidariorum]
MTSLNPVRVLKGDTEEEKREDARLSCIFGSIAIGDLLKTTLGPKGMDKILVSDSKRMGSTIELTNDGATILRSIGVDNPAAKILVEMSKVQDNEVGDGTTTVTVLASELLKEADKLITVRLHPQTIISGWRKAAKEAKSAMTNFTYDRSADAEQFDQDLMNIARTTLSSKILNKHKDFFAKIAIAAVKRLNKSTDLKAIQFIKKLGGTLTDSFLDDGFLLDKKPGVGQPKVVENARILIANTPMDADKVKVFGSRITLDSVAKLGEMELIENEKMKAKVDAFLKHNINVFINRQLIYNYPEQLFADAGVMAIEHADFDGVERLALVTGSEIVSDIERCETVKLGTCGKIEEIMLGEDHVLKFSGLPVSESCTIVLRGATEQILNEAERALHDVLCVLVTTISERLIVLGGGCTEMIMARHVNALAAQTPGKESLAMEAYARALLQIPIILADNGGYDSAQLVSELRSAQSEGKTTYGLNMQEGKIDDMFKLGIIEPYKVKCQVLSGATEAAEMILRVDGIIKSAPRRRAPDDRHC